MTEKETQTQTQELSADLQPLSITNFEHAQRVAKALSSSNLIPQNYQGNIPNTLVALEMANRIGASPLMVMQNLHVIHGRPSWSSSFIIAALNSCGRFSALKFVTDKQGCKAVATELATGELIEGPTVTLEMASAEGWATKAGSKWKTMPELMLRYRAAAFFGRLYAPDILMGMQTAEEAADVVSVKKETIAADLNEKL
jgi:hypothetical protein